MQEDNPNLTLLSSLDSNNNDLLVHSLRKGDVKAFNHFYHEFYTPLFYYCRHYVHDDEEARDIISATLQKCWEKREQFQNYLNIRSFLYLVVKNASLDYLKARARKLSRLHEFSLSPGLIEDPDTNYLEMEAEILKRIYQEVAQLPEKCRRVFELSYLEGKNIAEISELLHISPSNVTSQRSRAIRLLRIALADSPVVLLCLVLRFPLH